VARARAFQQAGSGSRDVVSATRRADERHIGNLSNLARCRETRARFRVAPLLPSRRVVECWIGVSDDRGRRVVRLAGRFGEAQVPEFLCACEGASELTLDLIDLVSADVAGLDALHRIRLRGARFVGASGYIQLKLDACRSGAADRQSRV
jgi:hypothetical protein